MVWILYSEPIMSIDEHKQTVDIKIEFLLVLPLVDVMLSTHIHTNTFDFVIFCCCCCCIIISFSSSSISLSLALALPQCILCNKKHTRLKFHIFNITTIRTAFWFTFDNSTDTVHTPVFMMGMKFIRVKLASQHVSYKIYCILCLLDWWIPSWCALCVLIVSPSTSPSSLVLFLFCFFQVKSSKI